MSPDTGPNLRRDDDSEDSLEVFKENLYSRNEFSDGVVRRGDFKKHETENVPKDWGKNINGDQIFMEKHVTRMSLLKKIFLASIGFFVISVGIAFYVFFAGSNVVSSNNVSIAVSGPVSVPGGEVLPLDISIANQNNADLVTADLVIDYPEGTRDPSNTNTSLKRSRQPLGTINKGAVATKKIQAVLFGQEGDVKTVAISVEYRLKGSNALFSKKKDYNVSISSSPVTLKIESVKDINSSQDVEFTVDVISNSKSLIKNLAVSAEYPFGFTFSSSDPKTSWSNSFWQLGDVKPGVKRTIKIRGKIVGQDSEDRVFKFSVGTEDPKNDNAIGTSFLTGVQKITIKKPFIGTNLSLDSDSSEVYVALPGKPIRAELNLSNNSGVKLADLKVTAKIRGAIFDQSSVSTQGGFYRSSDNTIVWDQTLTNGLAFLNPDEDANLTFSIGTIPASTIRLINNPEMQIEVTVTGKRLNESGVSQEISSSINKKIRVASNLGLSSRALYYSGPFTNTGPIPPRVDKETSYTIVWSLTNSSNELSDVRVSATLPSYVKWLDVTSPSSENISYSPIGGKIVWDVGTLKSGTGFSNSPREVSFQVSFSPSSTQLNSTPILITDVSAQGSDAFANVTVQANNNTPVTTNLTTDVGFRQDQGIVTR